MGASEDRIRQKIENLRLVLLEKYAATEPGRMRTDRVGLEDIGGAVEIRGRRGQCLLIEKDVGTYVKPESLRSAASLLLGSGAALPSFVFLDLETTGFSSTPLFLAGMLFERQGKFKAAQLLARDYSEEAALIEMLDGLLCEFTFCITFNGKSFDMPYIRERAKYNKVDLKACPEQFDLLHHARRKWKHSLPNCRLVTLESHILGRRRIGDVPGWEVPCIYHEFVHTKDARKLKDVLRHNLIDVLSMAELLVSIAEAEPC